MVAPFPGMDPYLEQPERWSGVHAALIAVLREILTLQVAPRYFVDSEDHVYIIAPDDPARPLVRPDIYVVETATEASPRRARGQIATPVVIDLPAAMEVAYPYLEVRDTADRQVVATIELLSPINKVAGSSGQRDFLRKRQQVIHSTTHWIEIDLLRAGSRWLSVPGGADYYAALHRAGVADALEVWFATLREELPTIAVPLRGHIPDVPLDLQEAIDTVYLRYRYDTAIDYNQAPPPPSPSVADEAWIEHRIALWRQVQSD